LVADLRIQWQPEQGQGWRGPWVGDPYAGRFTWRDRHAEIPLEKRMQSEFVRMGDSWPPLRGGLFDGSIARADAAFASYIEVAAEARGRRR
jgi:hypothetical protein